MRRLAGLLEDFQLMDTAVDGAFDAGFVAGEFGEGVGALAIGIEGAADQVFLEGRFGRRRFGFAVLFGVLFFIFVDLLAERVFTGDIVEAVAKDAGLHGENAVEAPLAGGDAVDQFFLGGTFRVKANDVVVEEEQEFLFVVAGEHVLAAGEAVFEAVAAGGGLSRVRFGTARFFGVLAVGVGLRIRGGAGIFRIDHGVV